MTKQNDGNTQQTRFPKREEDKQQQQQKMRNVMNTIYFSKSLSLTPPHLPFFHLSAAASSPNRAVHCMADDSPLSQPPNRSGDGSVSVPPPSPASSAIDFLSLCSRLKVNVTSTSNDHPIRLREIQRLFSRIRSIMRLFLKMGSVNA